MAKVRGHYRKYQDFVKLGYAGNISLDFKTTTVPPRNAKRLVSAIGGYNEFEPRKVNKAIDKIQDVVGSIEVGREGSPVLYIHLSPNWQLEQNKERVKEAFKEAKADEVDEVEGLFGSKTNTIRVWWD